MAYMNALGSTLRNHRFYIYTSYWVVRPDLGLKKEKNMQNVRVTYTSYIFSMCLSDIQNTFYSPAELFDKFCSSPLTRHGWSTKK